MHIHCIPCHTSLGLAILQLLPLQIPGSLRFVTAGALGLGLYSLAALGLGMLGVLNRNTAMAFPLLSIAVFLAIHLPHQRAFSFSAMARRAENWLNTKMNAWWVWLAPVSVLAAAAVAASLPPGAMWLEAGDPHPYDVLEYHLQVPREWQETGKITALHHNVYCFFPANVEMQYLLTMHIAGNAWRAMYVAQFITLGYGFLSVIAMYAAARAVLPSSIPPLLAAAAAATVPWLVMLSSVAYNEAGLVLYISLGIAWIVQGLTNPNHRLLSFAFAGVMAGLACGVKYTAVPIAAILFLCILFFPRRLFRSEIRAGALLGGCAIFAITTALAFSPWIVRNWRWTANPVFPEAMNVFGRGHFAPEQQARWERAHSPTADQRTFGKKISAFAREALGDQRYAFLLLPTMVLAFFTTRWTPAGAIAFASLLGLTIFWIGFSHLQSRFYVLALPLRAIILGQPSRSAAAALVQNVAVICLLFAGTLFTHKILYDELERIPDFRRVIGHQDLSAFLPRLTRDRIIARANIALVGDARAFLYTLPSSHLRYRTIFDVGDVDPSSPQKIIDAWLGPDAPRLRKECTIIIDQDELDRMLTTYILGRRWTPQAEPRLPLVIPPQP